MPYWDIVARSFRIAWKHKYLWLIGLLSGEGGGFSFNYSQGTTRTTTPGRPAPSPDFAAVQQQIATWIADHIALLVLIAVAWLILVVALFILGAICEGATVRAAAEHDAERPFGLGWAWRSGRTTMWAIVRLRLLILALSLPLIVLFAGLAIGVFAALVSKNYVAVLPLVLLGLALVLVAIPYAIYVSFLDRFGARALVLEQLAARPSIVRAHRLLRKRLGRSLLVWLISIGVSIALGIGLACALALVAVPFFILGAFIATGSSAAIVPLVILGVVLLVPIALVVQGFVAAEISTYWTLAFRRLDLDYPPAAAAPTAQALPG